MFFEPQDVYLEMFDYDGDGELNSSEAAAKYEYLRMLEEENQGVDYEEQDREDLMDELEAAGYDPGLLDLMTLSEMEDFADSAGDFGDGGDW